MMIDLTVLGSWLRLAWPYWTSLVVISFLLIYEHQLVSPDDLSKINIAFFNINSYISAVLLIGVTGALIIA